jgi:molybdopterin synthase catalytic subunit
VVIHRVGRLLPGDNIVLVVTASAHRQAAFEAAQFMMDYLKTQAPFWKTEETGEQRRWVEAQRSDDAAAEKWR